jgi:hypothetical protein
MVDSGDSGYELTSLGMAPARKVALLVSWANEGGGSS